MRKIKSLNKKHHKITTDYGKQKSKHLERLTDKMLKNDEKAQKLKSKQMNRRFKITNDQGQLLDLIN